MIGNISVMIALFVFTSHTVERCCLFSVPDKATVRERKDETDSPTRRAGTVPQKTF